LARIRILLVDDHELVRRSIRGLLGSQSDFEVIGEAITGLDAIEQARERQPDVILLDISLPALSGLAALPHIREVAQDAKVLMVTNHDDSASARAAISAGAHGFLTKSDISAQLALAIRQVYANETFLSKSLKLDSREKSTVPSLGNAEA
jgi:DNA-binding NarL/FixJ family response regulator